MEKEKCFCLHPKVNIIMIIKYTMEPFKGQTSIINIPYTVTINSRPEPEPEPEPKPKQWNGIKGECNICYSGYYFKQDKCNFCNNPFFENVDKSSIIKFKEVIESEKEIKAKVKYKKEIIELYIEI